MEYISPAPPHGEVGKVQKHLTTLSSRNYNKHKVMMYFPFQNSHWGSGKWNRGNVTENQFIVKPVTFSLQIFEHFPLLILKLFPQINIEDFKRI